MPRDIRIICSLIGSLLTVSSLLMFIVPAENIWPWVFLFGSLGLGLLIGAGFSTDVESRQSASQS